MEQATLRKFVSISVLLHGALFGLLLFLGLYSPPFSDRPLRVRLIEPPGMPAVPVPAPPASSESSPRQAPPPRVEKAPERAAPPPAPPRAREVERPAPPARPPEPQPAAPEKAEVKPPPAIPPPAPTPPAAPAAKVEPPPAPRSGTSEPTQESAPPGAGGREAKAPPLPAESAPASKPPPQVASLPALPPVELPRTAAPEVTQRVPRPAGPETALVSPPAAPPLPGLSLGGASKELGPPAPGAAGSPARPARPSLRDQIASLGSGEWAEGQGSAKQTIDLDNREPHYVDYLALLKRRIERVWGYPPEAANSGISGDLLLIFTLNKSGSLIDLRLIRSSGFPVLDEAAIRAVKLAAPYDPFPPYMGTDPWNIRASFTYYLPYGFRRY